MEQIASLRHTAVGYWMLLGWYSILQHPADACLVKRKKPHEEPLVDAVVVTTGSLTS